MPDAGHRAAEAALTGYEEDIRAIYQRAADETGAKLRDYLAAFREQDELKAAKVASGELTEAEYKSWRLGKIASGKKYQAMLDDFARSALNANISAAALMSGMLPAVYAENRNFAAWQVYDGTGTDVVANLYDASTVAQLVMGRDAFPRPSVNVPKDMRWNRNRLNAEITQGILQGQSMPAIAGRISNAVGSNYASSMRAARTAVTAAENMGRVDTYNAAKGMGIGLKQQWLATLDGRTRSSHAAIDGEVVEVGEKFSNGCEYPGDPGGPGAEIYNCRCTLVPWFPDSDMQGRVNGTGMSYDEWKAMHKASQTVTLPSLLGFDLSAPVYAGIGGEHLSAMSGMLSNANVPRVAEMYKRYEGELKMLDSSYKRGAHYQTYRHGVNMHVANSAKAADGPYSTWFHEFGHNIDNLAARGTAGKNKLYSWASVEYENGLFGKTLREEAMAMVDARHKQLKDEFKLYGGPNGDMEWQRKHGIIDKWLYEARDVAHPSNFPAKYKKAMAYKSIEMEIRGLTVEQRANLSDIFEGATKAKIRAGWGHGVTYWNDEWNLPIEAFAEFTQAAISSEASLEILRQWLPRSYEVYLRVVEYAMGG